MLFDVRGRRKRFIQVTYVVLAFLFAVGLVGFGIGGNTQGGFFDALTPGGGGGGSNVYEKEAERAQKTLRLEPRNERAWAKLAQAKVNIARTGDDYDSDTGQFEEGAVGDLKEATRAWERYLKLKPKKPNGLLANQMVQVYATLLRFETTGSSPLDLFNQAARAQEIFAEDRPSSIAYFNLATIYFQIGKIGKGDEAGDEALRRTPKDQRNTVRAQIAEVREEGIKLKREQKKAEKQAAEAAKKASKSGKDPFGAPPTGPTTPGS